MIFHKALVVVVFGAVAFGSGVYQSHLKAWPQVVTIIIAVAVLVAHYMRQVRVFDRAWTTLFAITMLEALLVLGEEVHLSLYPKEGVIIVDGVERHVMTYGWVWPVLIAFLLTPLLIWIYRRYSGRVHNLEFPFACAMLIVWSTLFVVHEA